MPSEARVFADISEDRLDGSAWSLEFYRFLEPFEVLKKETDLVGRDIVTEATYSMDSTDSPQADSGQEGIFLALARFPYSPKGTRKSPFGFYMPMCLF